MNRMEVRNYEGDGTDLALLVNRTWTKAFAGKTWFPLWDRPFFSWRLLDGCGRDRDFLVAAYQGSKLVGCLLAEALDLRVGDRAVRGTLSSWLSVDPDAGTPDMAVRLVEGLRKRHIEHGIAISIGVTSSDPGSPMRRFWSSLAKRKPADIRFLQPIRFWTRVFDGKTVSRAGLNTFERASSRLSAFIPTGWVGWRTPSGVRRYEPADLDRCLQWLRDQAMGANLAIEWSRSRLALQLGHPYVTTLVIDDGDRGGFINYYSINYSGGQSIRVGLIDLCAGKLSLARQLDLLKAAGEQMKADAVQMTMMMASTASPGRPLVAAGFVPVPAHLDLFAVFPAPNLQLQPPLRVHTLFT